MKPPVLLDPNVIAWRASEIWQRHGCPKGEELSEWLEAELELRSEIGDAEAAMKEVRDATADHSP